MLFIATTDLFSPLGAPSCSFLRIHIFIQQAVGNICAAPSPMLDAQDTVVTRADRLPTSGQ